MLKYRRVVRERVAFRAEMVDKEMMELLDHASVIHLGGFTTVIDQFELVFGLLSSHVITREI